jgi:response regulator of citrate/malate metabolism
LVDKKSTSCSVKFAPDVEEAHYFNDDSLEANNDQTANDINIARLTNKKKQYLQDSIFDKNGAYSYLEDPVEYKKARKRLQNRESAVRSRQRKKSYQEELEKMIEDQNELIQELKSS